MTSKPLSICYHGTSEENARSILRDGFLPYTWFAQHLENAIGYGGPHVFEVVFAKKDIERAGWQFRPPKAIPVERIVSYRIYDVTERLGNKELRRHIFESNARSDLVALDVLEKRA